MALGPRPLTRLTIVGMAGHVFFELGAGVGMPSASVIGPTGAAAAWATGTGVAWRVAGSRSAAADRPMAVLNGIGLAAVVAHLVGWPRRRTRVGLPWLRECEGLGPEQMPVYNSLLYVSGAVALAAVALENRSASRRLALAALPLVPLLVAAQHAEHRRLTRLAAERPGWWNRRLRRNR